MNGILDVVNIRFDTYLGGHMSDRVKESFFVLLLLMGMVVVFDLMSAYFAMGFVAELMRSFVALYFFLGFIPLVVKTWFKKSSLPKASSTASEAPVIEKSTYVNIDTDYSDHYEYESGYDFFEFEADKGLKGEATVFYILSQMDYYSKILTNVYLPVEDKTTEIDVLYITQWGIYVIESKNYNGWIFGNEKDKYWTQTFGKKKKYRFYNPVRQNKSHMDHLDALLKGIRLFPLVVFGNKSTLKDVQVSKYDVIHMQDLSDYINKTKRDAIYTADQVDLMYRYLGRYAYKSEEEKQAHVEQLKTYR